MAILHALRHLRRAVACRTDAQLAEEWEKEQLRFAPGGSVAPILLIDVLILAAVHDQMLDEVWPYQEEDPKYYDRYRTTLNI